MNITPEISIILPVYNAEKFINRTLRNIVLEQFNAFPESAWEIIAVNDCSSDSSAKILDTWHRLYPDNIKIISFDRRSGVSNARNAAIQSVKGAFIYMMDADDLLPQGVLKMLINTAKTNNADLVRFAYRQISPEEYASYNMSAPRLPDFVNFRSYTATEFLNITHGLIEFPGLWSVWSSLFRMDFIKNNHLQFIPNLIIGEDCLFQWTAMLHNPRMSVSTAQLYLYTKNPDGCINGVDTSHIARKADGLTKLAELEKEFIHNNRPAVSQTVTQGWTQALTYVLRDRLACLIAINSPIAITFAALKEFILYRGIISPSQHPFCLPSVKLSPKASLIAWIATRICACAKKFYKSK